MNENVIKWVDVDSSQISRIGYDEERNELHIEFKSNGKRYYYKNVPKEVFDDFLLAESIGKYFYKNIKGVYEYVKYYDGEKEGKGED